MKITVTEPDGTTHAPVDHPGDDITAYAISLCDLGWSVTEMVKGRIVLDGDGGGRMVLEASPFGTRGEEP